MSWRFGHPFDLLHGVLLGSKDAFQQRPDPDLAECVGDGAGVVLADAGWPADGALALCWLVVGAVVAASGRDWPASQSGMPPSGKIVWVSVTVRSIRWAASCSSHEATARKLIPRTLPACCT